MAPERKNKIWAMLDAEAQEWIKEQYQEILEDIADYKEQNTNNGFPIMENRAIGQNQMLIRLFGKHNITAQAGETCKENGKSFTNSHECVKELANSFQSFTDWNKYRLDLAKELTSKIFAREGINAAYVAVDAANEIVKRLKETEI